MGRSLELRAAKQKWLTFHGTKREAQAKLRELLGDSDRGEFVEPSKRTVGEWLDEWLAHVRTRRAANTFACYKNVDRSHLKPRLGSRTLQALRPVDIEAYATALQSANLSAGTARIITT